MESGSFSQHRLDTLWQSYDPASVEKNDLLHERFLLAAEGRYRVYYAPLGTFPEPSSRVILVGLTPGLTQVRLAARAYQEVGEERRRDAVAFGRILKSRVAFGGPMRTNLCTMLDELDLHKVFGAASTTDLFETSHVAIATTSALVYPVFTLPGYKNFGGTVNLAKTELFRKMIIELLEPRLSAAPDALIVPLGKSALSGIAYLVSDGRVAENRVLSGFPHPSGGNGHRHVQFRERKADLRHQLEVWSARISRDS